MTWITDGSGTSWVDIPLPKRRKSPRAVRFAEIKVGDQLMKTWRHLPLDQPPAKWFYLVTDLWFDPVAGQDNHVSGEKVAIVQIKADGSLCSRKEPHTKRGLASQGFHYSDLDFLAMTKAWAQAENVVGIGYGNVIRKRPKLPSL